MADFNGDYTSAPGTTYGSPSGVGRIVPPVTQLFGSPGGSGGTASMHRYKLRAHRTSDNTWQTWNDATVGLGAAPGGSGNYDAASLTVEGSLSS